jgi:GNAT superfamily N-acetyltransferase
MLRIRAAQREDVPTVLALIRGLAEYEREPDSVKLSEADLLRDGFGPTPLFHVLMALWDDKPVGFAFYVLMYSTWVGRVLYLEDLFVRPEHRGKGAGVALMRELARTALAHDCRRFVWQVLDWNEPTIRFYESLGASIKGEWRTVWLTDEPLRALAR